VKHAPSSGTPAMTLTIVTQGSTTPPDKIKQEKANRNDTPPEQVGA